MKELGFIGFGNFGRFIIPHLKPFFDITVYDSTDFSKDAKHAGVKWGTLAETAAKDFVALAVPVQFLESLLLQIKTQVKPKALVFDLSSVKIKPVELMLKHLPENVEIIGTHPLFGPQSGKNGIAGLNLVICPVRTKRNGNLSRFFSRELKLNVLERTPLRHDKQMAYVQALTHFIGRAVNQMDIPDVEQKTPAYQYLLEIKRNLGQDSMDLFLTIENENPFAKDVRDRFIEELVKLNGTLNV
ncbi:MAG TPA: prephenate dehydrogenase/arogenate dehydrogenase family protein [Cytophagaceae bacterium]|jgi:prephenate dehydrogenase|nr:prephenate dehydrogenase/arogenate dehydrogenase family protein [Cytophagaceae bacterium]